MGDRRGALQRRDLLGQRIVRCMQGRGTRVFDTVAVRTRCATAFMMRTFSAVTRIDSMRQNRF
ncbi:hypothetical protein CVN68_09260 [Sphingomonas psychrotolerans]|uniref:Uncharacterized protein n=1 Tax=Sphingomonas psychrotolerans TaxID=1327635 RepID=A0A2K8ME17_9SPHN|nr:hypothetical protein CVN68_09260 [Sphingomonas psychrotolerans]